MAKQSTRTTRPEEPVTTEVSKEDLLFKGLTPGGLLLGDFVVVGVEVEEGDWASRSLR